MGINGRSKAFRDVSCKNLTDAGFPDRVKRMQAVAKTSLWMDTSCVGVTGGSAGGQNAPAALLRYNDFYKAAVAESGSHDDRMSDYKWAEMFLSWPVGASYETNSNCVNAGKLSGTLLLVTGEVDNVVDPATTMRFASALIEANEDFDLAVVPKVGHFIAGLDWLQQKRAQFFKRRLQV
ncbi:peptidase S9, prolyl oligopeptidase active site domain protein [Akanthomyces lecanii RCEF 1005]|uniref:Peptidase S9, prolyl oligopeptidase active site domain protein n=1 Tax=Akanthomyces lecanii RCEF 1005 TaxID=1081108 RepID=A0A168GHE7_CORDF|nr:peptidase S9, prolyl oligopeptidase active site domain protein [Akanthomyces lecanii RCEF 1005]